MRQAWMPSLVHRRLLQLVLGGSAILTSWGCHQHYHYYTNPACPPGTVAAPATVQYGAACDPPTQVVDAGTTLSETPSSRATTVSGSRSSSRVVVSEPKDSSRSSSWRRSDPDASVAATTTVEGGLNNNSSVNR
jgi:hypothetical protein